MTRRSEQFGWKRKLRFGPCRDMGKNMNAILGFFSPAMAIIGRASSRLVDKMC